MAVIIVSFGWTWPAFVARQKTVTRRDWTEAHARKFQVGAEFKAYDRLPRASGKPIGIGRITESVVREPLSQMPARDYEAEGFAFLADHPELLPESVHRDAWFREGCSRQAFEAYRNSAKSLYVVRFEVIEIFADAAERLERKSSQAAPGDQLPRQES